MHLLLILFQQNEGWLSPDVSLTLEKLNLPDTIAGVKDDVCWQIRILNYDVETGTLVVELLNYNYPFHEFPEAQVQLMEGLSVNALRIPRLDSLHLLRQVFFKPIMAVDEPEMAGEEALAPALLAEAPEKETDKASDNAAQPPTLDRVIWRQIYRVPLKNIRFGFGQATMVFYVEPLMKEGQFQIENIHLRPEYDAVKEYFGKKLGGKQLEVRVWVEEMSDGEFVNKAECPALLKINADFIESIRFEMVRKSFRAVVNTEINKALFTPDDLLGHFNQNLPGLSGFYDESGSLFNDIMSVQSSRHYKHLRYLSSLHAADTLKLRFVLKPFSFIFLVKGPQRYHIVWESLDSEDATYLWHIDKTLAALKLKLAEVEQILNTVKVQGKIAYLNDRPEDFSRVFHDYSNVTDGFAKWKAQLDERLL